MIDRLLRDGQDGREHQDALQSSLTLTDADSYFGWPKQPSRFLAEMGLHAGSMAC
ncbi:MAG: hypothetical protein OXG72_21845 [Acidobacteria bacterium]|nr:hypothetical protein [Acidobacteriota bacterium]